MSRIALIQAGPTPWDVEDRLGGNHPLPLTDLAIASINNLARNLPTGITAVYRYKKNESCDQAAKIVSAIIKVKPSDAAGLDEMNLGLWQGMTRKELRRRHPKVFPQWEEDAFSVNPPDGETLPQAVERVRGALNRILRRKRGVSIVLVLRPLVMQIAIGLIKHEDPPTIAKHLQNTAPVETIEMDYAK